MNYHKIEKTSISNGEGIRCVCWVSGCEIHCPGCQNPETWDFDSGKPFDEKAKEELFEVLDKPYIQGITFSGGHPLAMNNVGVVHDLIKEIKDKFPDKDIWLYTGYTLDDNLFKTHTDVYSMHTKTIFLKTIFMCDVVVDGDYREKLRDITLRFKGSTNQRIIDIKKSIEAEKIVLWE